MSTTYHHLIKKKKKGFNTCTRTDFHKCKIIGHFRVSVNLIVKARLSAKFSFLFNLKDFVLNSLAFIMRFTATQKWPIVWFAIPTTCASGESDTNGLRNMETAQ